MPFEGPIELQSWFKDGAYLLNPGYEALKDGDLNMMVAGTEEAVLMVESEAKELSEDQMLGAVLFGHQEMQVVISSIREFAADVGIGFKWTPPHEVGIGCSGKRVGEYRAWRSLQNSR